MVRTPHRICGEFAAFGIQLTHLLCGASQAGIGGHSSTHSTVSTWVLGAPNLITSQYFPSNFAEHTLLCPVRHLWAKSVLDR